MPKVDFHEFEECGAETKVSLSKIHIQRRDTEVGMVFDNHHGGRRGPSCDGWGNGTDWKIASQLGINLQSVFLGEAGLQIRMRTRSTGGNNMKRCDLQVRGHDSFPHNSRKRACAV